MLEKEKHLQITKLWVLRGVSGIVSDGKKEGLVTCGDGVVSAVIPREPQQVKLLVDCVDSVATWEGFDRSWKLFGGWWLSRRFPT